MSIQPVMPHQLLTATEYLEIGEVDSGYTELGARRLLLSPSPTYGTAGRTDGCGPRWRSSYRHTSSR